MLTAGSISVYVDGDRSGRDFTYYRGALRRNGKVVWECDANAWDGHQTRSAAKACASKVLHLIVDMGK